MNWFTRQRLEWISETLRVFGYINREHLQRKFGISQPQASTDLATFQRWSHNVMAYDASRKCYVAVSDEKRGSTKPPARSTRKPAR
jgi:hypothetical protein